MAKYEGRRKIKRKDKRERKSLGQKQYISTYDRGMRHFTHIYIWTRVRDPTRTANTTIPTKQPGQIAQTKDYAKAKGGRVLLLNSLFVTRFLFTLLLANECEVANK